MKVSNNADKAFAKKLEYYYSQYEELVKIILSLGRRR